MKGEGMGRKKEEVFQEERRNEYMCLRGCKRWEGMFLSNF